MPVLTNMANKRLTNVTKFVTNHKHLLCCSVILYKYFSQNVENVGSQIALEVETDDVAQ